MNAKGFAVTDTVVQAVIIGAVIGILILGTTNLMKTIQGGDVIERCRTSVFIAANTKSTITGGKAAINLDCPRVEKTVKLKDVKDNDGNLLPDMVNKQMAEQMRTCWYKFHEGKLNGFNQDFFHWTGLSKEKHCVICSTITFSADIGAEYEKRKNEPMILNFYEYINKNKIPQTATTYARYLATEGQKDGSHIFKSNGTDELIEWQNFAVSSDKNNQTQFHVMYVTANPSWIIGNNRAFCGTAIAGAAATGAVGGSIGGAIAGLGVASVPGYVIGGALGAAGGALQGTIACVAKVYIFPDSKAEPNVYAMEVNDIDNLQCDSLI